MSEPIKWTNVTLKLSQLKKWENNPAEISKEAAGRLVECFNEFGQIETLAVDPENRLVDGHQRLDTWLAKYGDIEVDCRKASRLLTEKERQKIAVMLRSGAVGRYNWDVVSSWAADDLQGWGMDSATLKEWKHDVSALDNFIESEKKEPVDAEPQIDRAAELNEKWQVKTGDLWQIGEHRLLCGDSTVKADVDRVMGGEKADMVFTSPPYNGNTTMYDYIIVDGKKKRKDKTLYEDNQTDNKTSEEYILFLHAVLGICFDFTEGFIFWNVSYNANSRHEYIDGIYPFRDKLEETIIWKKNALPTANGLTRNTEFIFMFRSGSNIKHLNKEYEVVHTLWDINNSGSQDDIHKACFPIGLPTKAIGMSDMSKIIYEPFCGSGTTMVACQNLHRKCRAIEISPNYCAVILERMSTAFPELEIKKL